MHTIDNLAVLVYSLSWKKAAKQLFLGLKTDAISTPRIFGAKPKAEWGEIDGMTVTYLFILRLLQWLAP